MRIPFITVFMKSPFEELMEHAAKVKDCVWAFQQAFDCYFSKNVTGFEEHRKEVMKIESEADAIKRRIRGHIPVGTRMVVAKFQLFQYLKEQDRVLDSVEESLDWLSYRVESRLPEDVQEILNNLLSAVVDPIENLSRMVTEAKEYFISYSDKQREMVKNIIVGIRQREHEADGIESELKRQIFAKVEDPISIYHFIRLAEMVGSIADAAENAADTMRAMISRKKGLFFGEK